MVTTDDRPLSGIILSIARAISLPWTLPTASSYHAMTVGTGFASQSTLEMQ